MLSSRLILVFFCLALPGCDSAEEPPARFDGQYRAIGPWHYSSGRAVHGGPYGYHLDLRVANDAAGTVSGSGTFVFINERRGPQSRPVEVTGTTEDAGVGMRMTSEGYDDLFFWGRVSDDGTVIDGALSTRDANHVPATLEARP